MTSYTEAAYIPKHIDMSRKQYFSMNISKFIIEIIGTASLGIFYIILGDHQVGMLLGHWIVTMFASQISGSHFNPVVTLVQMFRSGNSGLDTKLLGLIYIAAQIIGGIIAGIGGILLLEPANPEENYKFNI